MKVNSSRMPFTGKENIFSQMAHISQEYFIKVSDCMDNFMLKMETQLLITNITVASHRTGNTKDIIILINVMLQLNLITNEIGNICMNQDFWKKIKNISKIKDFFVALILSTQKTTKSKNTHSFYTAIKYIIIGKINKKRKRSTHTRTHQINLDFKIANRSFNSESLRFFFFLIFGVHSLLENS